MNQGPHFELTHGRHRLRGFTFIELLVVTAAFAILISILLAARARAKQTGSHIKCINNLRQIGMGFRLFATDHDDQHPATVSTNAGGSAECADNGQAVFWHFKVLSNELVTPKIVICPADRASPRRVQAANFGLGFSRNQNISYFAGLKAAGTGTMALLAGDRNITSAIPPLNVIATKKGAVVTLGPNAAPGWTRDIHRNAGNISFGDGSVQSLTRSRLREQWRQSGSGRSRIAVPD